MGDLLPCCWASGYHASHPLLRKSLRNRLYPLERRLLAVLVMESLVEIIFIAAAVIMALGLVARGLRARFVLGFGGVLLATVGIALFVLIAYPLATLLFLGAGCLVTGAGSGYAQITPWRAHRGTCWSTAGRSAEAKHRMPRDGSSKTPATL
jgi:hypothetical protein